MAKDTQDGFVQGSSITTFNNYGLSNSYLPTISGDQTEKIIYNNTDTSRQAFFDDSIAVHLNPGHLQRITVPNFDLSVSTYGVNSQIEKDKPFNDIDHYIVERFPDNNIERFISNVEDRDQQTSGIIDVFNRQDAIRFYRSPDAPPVVVNNNIELQRGYGDKFKNSEMEAGLAGGANSRFDGETQIKDYYELLASPVVPLVEQSGGEDASLELEHWKVSSLTDDRYKSVEPNIDISTTPFIDETKKDCDYNSTLYTAITDTTIIDTFVEFVSGTTDADFKCNTKYANHGFEYTSTTFGLDSLAFGGFTR